MEKIKQISILKIIVLFILSIIIVRCANQQAPGGGERDLVPPEIVEIYPPNLTKNFTDDYFEISFSEHVDKRTAQDAIFISPSIEGEFDYSWTGTNLEIGFEDSLRENTTYIVTIGTDVKDVNNRNNMAEAVSFAFSTGDKIDRGEISGKVYHPNPTGIIIGAYIVHDSIPNPTITIPDFISQVGNNGIYKLPGLAKNKYAVYAIEDRLRDLIYKPEDDGYGVYNSFVSLTEKDSIIKNVNFKMSVEDTSSPHLVSAIMTDRYHIMLEFNESIDSSIVDKSNFHINDSTTNVNYLSSSFFKGNAKKFQYFLTVSDSLSDTNNIFVYAKNILDMNSNLMNEESISLTVSNRPDTTAPEIKKIISNYPSKNVDIDSGYLRIYYNDAIDYTNLDAAITVMDDKERVIKKSIEIIDDAEFVINIEKKMKSNSELKVKFNFGLLPDIQGNKLDSVHIEKFRTVNDLDFSGVSGKVYTAQNIANLNIVLESADRMKNKYFSIVEENNTFEIDKVRPGKYLIWAYSNKTKDYNYGKVYPLIHSDKFVYYSDTLNLRKRWPVGDVFINFDNNK